MIDPDGITPETCKLRINILSKRDISDAWRKEAMVHAYVMVELGCDEYGDLYEIRQTEIDYDADGLRPIQETELFSLITQVNARLRANARCSCARKPGEGD